MAKGYDCSREDRKKNGDQGVNERQSMACRWRVIWAQHGTGALAMLAMWSAILKAKELGLKIFDFEGSVIPPIEGYFHGLGGVLKPVFGVHKAWLPLEMALKLRGR